MGYTTEFKGKFTVVPALTAVHVAYLAAFNETRRMKRNAALVGMREDKARVAVGLPVGVEGEYFVGATAAFGQENAADIVDNNTPPSTQPGLWCQWRPTPDGAAIEWDESEKFYEYTAWLRYLIDHFLAPWGYQVEGQVEWQGEDADDRGKIAVEANVVRELYGHVVYE